MSKKVEVEVPFGMFYDEGEFFVSSDRGSIEGSSNLGDLSVIVVFRKLRNGVYECVEVVIVPDPDEQFEAELARIKEKYGITG